MMKIGIHSRKLKCPNCKKRKLIKWVQAPWEDEGVFPIQYICDQCGYYRQEIRDLESEELMEGHNGLNPSCRYHRWWKEPILEGIGKKIVDE